MAAPYFVRVTDTLIHVYNANNERILHKRHKGDLNIINHIKHAVTNYNCHFFYQKFKKELGS